MKKTTFYIIYATLSLVLISSCGFHMRGLTKTSLSSIDLEGKKLSIDNDLRKVLKLNQVEIKKEGAEFQIEFLNEQFEKKILTLNSRGLVSEYELFYKIYFRIKNSSADKWSEENIIEIRRDYTYSDANSIGKEEEEKQLKRAMYDEAIQNLFRQIELLKNN